MSAIDIVVVSFNSRGHLRACLEALAGHESARIVVVDNASADGSLEAIADLPVTSIALDLNGGFAHACNVGAGVGTAPFVLFLNPDARIDWTSLSRLVEALEQNDHVAAVTPKILYPDGSLAPYQRRFPRLLSTFARALFLDVLFRQAAWANEIVYDKSEYEHPTSPEWVPCTCLLVRRSALERIDGFDESFFLYSEDIDLCRRFRDAGYDIRYEPAAVCIHEGGASAPRSGLLPILAESRVRYAKKHARRSAAFHRLAIALEALTHAVLARGGFASRAGHLRSLLWVVGASRTAPRRPGRMAGRPLV